MPTARPASERFWPKVDKREPDECWPWIASRDRYGYGQFGSHAASRVAWMLTKGHPGPLHVCHSCDNPACCNPDHLWLGTPRDNARDRSAKGRHRLSYVGQRKSHCLRGHAYDEANTYVDPRGFRQCRQCREIANQKRRMKERAK